MSLLNHEEIKQKGLIIENANDKNYRNASYDYEVKEIIKPNGDKIYDLNSFVLKSQKIAVFISNEKVKLPKNIMGYATVRNRLSQKGNMAINTGINDPAMNVLFLVFFNHSKKDCAFKEKEDNKGIDTRFL